MKGVKFSRISGLERTLKVKSWRTDTEKQQTIKKFKESGVYLTSRLKTFRANECPFNEKVPFIRVHWLFDHTGGLDLIVSLLFPWYLDYSVPNGTPVFIWGNAVIIARLLRAGRPGKNKM